MMDQPDFILKLNTLFNKIIQEKGVPEITEEIIKEFSDKCADTLRDLTTSREGKRDFSLRMSNIGKDTRQLWLEKEYGRESVDPSFIMKMTYGHLAEHLLIAFMKAAGVVITDEGKEVKLNVGDTTLTGHMDLKINNIIWDIKTASSYAYTNKFVDLGTVQSQDSFGYCGQGVGYSVADSTPFGGWIVIDKTTGEFKAVEAKALNKPEVQEQYLKEFETKIKLLDHNEGEVPPCTGVEEETFKKAPTGRKVLNKSCQYCSHKYKCHKDKLSYEPVLQSTAKNKPWRYYVND